MSRLPAGNYAIILTPFTEQGELDLKSLCSELEYAIAKKLTGVVVLGSNGEGPYLTAEEKARVIKKTGEICKGKIALVAGAIAAGTREAMEYAALARAAGFDSILTALPVYFHLEFEDVKRHYSHLAKQAGIEITFYHVPDCSGLELRPEQVAEIVAIPGVDSIKLTVMNREFISKTIELCWGLDCQFFIGTGLLVYEAMKLDAKGPFCPMCLIAPEDYRAMYDFIMARKWQEAFDLQEKLRLGGVALFAGIEADYETMKNGFMAIYNSPFHSQVMSHTRAAHHLVKEALRLKGIIATSKVRLPYAGVDERKSAWVRKVLADFGWL
jgi:dihydrodipicolinate synthase/N-acetylneuraminate lyase